jgi:invasion protein IalB
MNQLSRKNLVGNLLSGFVVFAVVLGGPIVPSATAAGVKAVASFKDWSVHVIAGKSGKTCYIHSEPKKSAGKYKTRGATYIQVTHRSRPEAANEISVTAGYAYRKGNPVDIAVDGKKFALFTEGDTAWSLDAAGDKALVAAMRAGTRMIIKGVSSRGTQTTDQYSLSGFTAAHKSIGKACKVK